MRTYLYLPAAFVLLLGVCLMFAPARQVTGDAELFGQSAPKAVPKTAPARPFADLCRDDPVGAIAASLAKYKADVEGYSCTFIKRERIDGKLREAETIACDFREAPFAVIMRWTAGKGRVEATLYAAGENDDQLLIIPAQDFAKRALKALGKPYAKRTLTSADAKNAARYPANEFGMYHGTERVYGAWRSAQERGRLKAEYLGLVAVPELGGQKCHVLRRTCDPPEEDGLTTVTVMFHPDTLLQAGSVLKAGDELIGSYFFKDVKLNPKFEAGHFLAERLK